MNANSKAARDDNHQETNLKHFSPTIAQFSLNDGTECILEAIIARKALWAKTQTR